jgi:hypothetical protein
MSSRWDSTGRRSTVSHTHHGDEGSIVIGWITKLAVVAAIFGVLGFDGISVGVAHLTTADAAANAVQAASQSYEVRKDINVAFAAAAQTLNSHEELQSKGFSIAADGTATLTITNTVKTLVLERTSKTKGWAVVSATASGKYTGS